MSARILVVDDSPTIRKVVASILSAREYEPILAEDGQNALELLGHEKVDLVLLDFVMPRMNGYQFCRELRANAELKNLPVVLMSAKGDKIRGHFVRADRRHRRDHQAVRRARPGGRRRRRAQEARRGPRRTRAGRRGDARRTRTRSSTISGRATRISPTIPRCVACRRRANSRRRSRA